MIINNNVIQNLFDNTFTIRNLNTYYNYLNNEIISENPISNK